MRFYGLSVMQTKLTLRIDSDLIEEAKKVAEERNVSLSRMAADLLRSVTKREGSIPMEELPPVTKSLYGSLKSGPAIDPSEEYRDFLEKKYS